MDAFAKMVAQATEQFTIIGDLKCVVARVWEGGKQIFPAVADEDRTSVDCVEKFGNLSMRLDAAGYPALDPWQMFDGVVTHAGSDSRSYSSQALLCQPLTDCDALLFGLNAAADAGMTKPQMQEVIAQFFSEHFPGEPEQKPVTVVQHFNIGGPTNARTATQIAQVAAAQIARGLTKRPLTYIDGPSAPKPNPNIKPAIPSLTEVQDGSRYRGMGFNGE